MKEGIYERWCNRTLALVVDQSNNGVKFKDMPKKVRLRLKLMHFIWDYLEWKAIKSGWHYARLARKNRRMYKRIFGKTKQQMTKEAEDKRVKEMVEKRQSVTPN